MQVRKQVDLSQRNTLSLPCIAETLIELESDQDLTTLNNYISPDQRPFILGGGSNVMLPPRLSQPVLTVTASDIHFTQEKNGSTLVDVEAGVEWDALVETCVLRGLRGIENLSLIPGSVGAAPVQNIGAYGVELADTLAFVRVYDFDLGEIRSLDREQCEFAYRDSLFKRHPGRFLILSVGLSLSESRPFSLAYGELKRLAESESLTCREVREEVIRVRRLKLPNPAELPNAGSFFKNPVVSNAHRDQLLVKYPELISYPVSDGFSKLAAGWLIDQAGWKGVQKNSFKVHDKQALVLVNSGRGSKIELLELAHSIQQDIQQKFGLDLEIEPVDVQA